MSGTRTLVLTGGPKSGKTSIKPYIEAHFEKMGYTVHLIPETATDLMHTGITPFSIGNAEFQRLVLVEQLRREDEAQEMMRDVPEPKIIIADRGTMDGLAYIEHEQMYEIWESLGHTRVSLRDKRYIGVIHLVTVAIGIEHLFNNDNNPTRYETCAEDAAATDHRTLAAWVGCPHLAYVDNSTGFDEKITRAIAWANYFAGSVECERKWKLPAPFNWSLLPPHARALSVRQSYIRLPDTKKCHRIRSRGEEDDFLHTLTMKKGIDKLSCNEDERYIVPEEYDDFFTTYSTPDLAEVVKERICFVENGLYWELDIFKDIPGLILLEAELPHPDWDVVLPVCCADAVDVTGIKKYQNKTIARALAKLKAPV